MIRSSIKSKGEFAIRHFHLRLFVFAGLFLAETILAAGYEKSALFGAKSASLGGAGALTANPAEALAFNPSLIAGAKSGATINLNYSPIQSQLQGPINNENVVLTSSQARSNSAGVFAGYTLESGLGFALGKYAVGGGSARYNAVEFSGFDDTLDLNTALKISETALGAAYRVTNQLSLGLSIRQLDYSFSYARVGRAYLGFAIAAPEFEDLEDTAYGYKLGATYKPWPGTQFIFVYRSPIDIEAKGRVTGGKALTPLFSTTVAPGDATLKTQFPEAYALGYGHKWSDTIKSYIVYELIKYSALKEVEIETTSSTVGNRTNVLEWSDQKTLRLGVEYSGFVVPLRVGYTYNSQVTSDDYANAMNFPPSDAHTYTLGLGYRFQVYGNPLTVDAAYDYMSASGDGNGAASGSISSDFRAGHYASRIVGFHLSLTYLWGT